MGKLAGQAVLVTGASTGIGAATARMLAAEGARLVLVARREELLREVASDCEAAGSPEATILPADLSDVATAERVAGAAWDAADGLDIVVNNAGMPKRRNVQQLPYDDVEAVMRLNYLSPVRIMLSLIPRMVRHGSGVIVNVGSLAARIGSPREGAYAASKHALTGFSEAAEVDLDGTGVHIRVVQPGTIQTPLWDDSPDNDKPIYDGPMYPPEDVAAAVLAAITGETFEYFVPADLKGIIEYKAKDLDTFLAGNIAYVKNAGGS